MVGWAVVCPRAQAKPAKDALKARCTAGAAWGLACGAARAQGLCAAQVYTTSTAPPRLACCMAPTLRRRQLWTTPLP